MHRVVLDAFSDQGEQSEISMPLIYFGAEFAHPAIATSHIAVCL